MVMLVLCCHVMMPNLAMIRGPIPFRQGTGRKAFLWTFAKIYLFVSFYILGKKYICQLYIYILKCQDHDTKLGLC